MIIQHLVVGDLSTNCYVLGCEDTRKGVVIDPGGDGPDIIAAIDRLKLDIEYIIDTHCHFDHILANDDVKNATGAKLAIHELELPTLKSSGSSIAGWLRVKMPESKPEVLLQEGDEIKFGNISLKVLHTPGHSPGHISLVCDGKAFVGDCLFYQGIGRTDFPGGSQKLLMESINKKLVPLGNETMIYSGHGPVTSIGQELRHNPWLHIKW